MIRVGRVQRVGMDTLYLAHILKTKSLTFLTFMPSLERKRVMRHRITHSS